ncbi:MAG: TonB-dependent receptor [Sphingomonadales bacterium]|nr:MAG: TonB-dependent receptor [Sphingomonadales bacterium]
MTHTTLRSAFLLGCSVCALSFGGPAFAQEDASETQLDTIVVTAQKVTQNLQDVPISVSSVSGDTLISTGTVSFEQLGQLVPSLTFRKGTTNANSALVLRGVGTISFSVAAEPSVSTVVDGIVLSRSGQAFTDLVDVERIEVLRGPQGTLFGKNASAGAVSVVSKGGTDKFEGDVQIGFNADSEYRGRVSLAGPITESLTARITGFYGTYDGNITNVFGGRNERVNGYEHRGGRLLLDWKAADFAKFRFITDYYEADDDCCAEVTGVSRGAVLDAELGFDNTRGEAVREINQNLVTQSNDRQWSATLQGDFDLPLDHTLTVVTGFRNWQNTEIREGDFLPRALVGTAELHDQGFVETDQYSAEIRLASDQSQTFTYQVGGFWWHSDNQQQFTRRDITCATTTLPTDPVTGGQPCNVADTVNTLFPTATSNSDVNFNNFAFFGQGTYNVTERLRFTGGVRWTRDIVEFTHIRAPGVNATTGLPATGPGVSGSPAGGTIAAGGNGTNASTGRTSNNNFSGKAVVQYDVLEDVMLYASYTRGYKGPAFNVFFNHTAPTNSVPIDAENSNSYEVGIKSRFFDNRLQVNASGYYVKYDGFQANNFILLNGAVVSNLTNAGTVTSAGFELETVGKIIPGWTVSSSVAYSDAKVQRFNPNPLTNAPDARDGTRLPLAPRWSFNLASDYERSLSSIGVPMVAYLRTSYSYTGDQFSDLGEGGPIEQYGIWNASFGLSDEDDKYRVTFTVRNILDESYIALNTSAGQRLLIPRDADRYVGVNLRIRLD